MAGTTLRAPMAEAVRDWGWEGDAERDDRGAVVPVTAERRSGRGAVAVAARDGAGLEEATLRRDGALVLAGRHLAAGRPGTAPGLACEAAFVLPPDAGLQPLIEATCR